MNYLRWFKSYQKRLKEVLKVREAKGVKNATGYGESETSTGAILRYPGDSPQENDPVSVVEVVDGEESETPAPDGEHVLPTEGLTITVSDGVITNVEQTTQQNNLGDGEGDSQLSKKISQIEKRFEQRMKEAEQREKALREQNQQLTKKVAELADLPVSVKELSSQVEGFSIGSSSGSTARFEEIKYGCQLLQKARSKRAENAEYVFTGSNKATSYRTGTNATIADNLTEELKEFAPELIETIVMDEEVMSHVTTIDYRIGGDAEAVYKMPVLDHSSTDGNYLKKGQPCGFTADGELVVTSNTMNIRPWHYNTEFCPREKIWSQYANGRDRVNNEQIPFEAQIFDFINRRIVEKWTQDVFTGDSAVGPVDGFITQIKAVAPTFQQVPLLHANFLANTPTNNPDIEIDKLYNSALFSKEFQRYAREDDFKHMIFTQHHQRMVKWVFKTWNSNVREDMNLTPTNYQAVPGEFVPLWLLEDDSVPEYYHLLTFPSMLYVGVSDEYQGPYQVDFGYERKTGEFWFKAEGHLGAGLPDPQRVILGVAL